MITFAFVVTLLLPVFGGEVKITAEAPTHAGCVALRRTLDREMRSMGMKFTITECPTR